MGCKCVRSGLDQDNNEIIKTPDQKNRINNIIKANIPIKKKKKIVKLYHQIQINKQKKFNMKKIQFLKVNLMKK